MAKILLVRTRSEKYDHPYGAPPLGLLYLASVLRQNNTHEVKILDMRADLLAPEDVVREFLLFRPDIFGISGFTVERGMLHRVAQSIKEKRPDCPVIVGGPHANACLQDVLDDPHVDCAILGEGERTFPELVEALLPGGKGLDVIKGIAFRNNGNIVKTQPREFIQNLDELPFPSWDLVDLKKYYMLPRFMPFAPKSGIPYMLIMTSRGCPFLCTFCHDVLGKRFRARSAENVFAEMETLNRRYGIVDFELIDDCFNLDKKRVHKLCELIIDSGLKFELSFPSGLRGDLLDEETLKKMRRAGAKLICYAPETGSPRLQKVIKKKMNLAKLQEVISMTVKLGIHTHGFFMLGFPTETKEDLEHTLRFIHETKLHTGDFFIVNVFPGTVMYEQTKEMGKNLPETYEDIDYHDAKYNLSEVTTEELLAYQRKFFMTFYFNPARMWRIFTTSPLIKKKYLLYYFKVFINRAIFRKREG